MELVPIPDRGRRFTASRRVRWGDADRDGRLRLDSIARYLQDVSNDDTRDAGDDPTAPWVVRRLGMRLERTPRIGEVVELTTFCGGIGSRWAERRVSITGEQGGRVEAATLWVHLDPTTGRPAKLPASFLEHYGEACGGREVSARLGHPPLPDGVEGRPWPLRVTDLDVLGHVNNAATWEAVVDELARLGVRAGEAEVEYRDAIEAGDEVTVASATLDDGRIGVWLTAGATVRASAVVTPR